jgi:hypothetical protein
MLAWWAPVPCQIIQIGPSERFARHDGFVDQKALLAHCHSSIWEKGCPGTPVLDLAVPKKRVEAPCSNQLRQLGGLGKLHRPWPGHQAVDYVDGRFPSRWRIVLISSACKSCFCEAVGNPEVPRMHWDSLLIETGETSFPPMAFPLCRWSTGRR